MSLDPAVANPAVADPAVADPVVADPVVAEPVVAEPAVADPVVADPVVTNPVGIDPAVIDPTALAAHADLDLCVRQHVDPIATGEPAALIRDEYLRCGTFWRGPSSAPQRKPPHP